MMIFTRNHHKIFMTIFAQAVCSMVIDNLHKQAYDDFDHHKQVYDDFDHHQQVYDDFDHHSDNLHKQSYDDFDHHSEIIIGFL